MEAVCQRVYADVDGGRMANEAEVVVVGGGPAGAAAAYYLASAGRDVVVLEKVHIPAR